MMHGKCPEPDNIPMSYRIETYKAAIKGRRRFLERLSSKSCHLLEIKRLQPVAVRNEPSTLSRIEDIVNFASDDNVSVNQQKIPCVVHYHSRCLLFVLPRPAILVWTFV
jgi:hypothetical protein